MVWNDYDAEEEIWKACNTGCTAWHNVLNENDWATISSWGCNVIRLGFTQEKWEVSYPYSQQYRDAIDKVVEFSETYGIYTILDNHWTSDEDSWRLHGCPLDWTTWKNMWVEVAEKYAGRSSVLFDIFNEPHEPEVENSWDGSWDQWRNEVQDCILRIREADFDGIILVSGINWGRDIRGVEMNPIIDPNNNIAYTLHWYPDDNEEVDFDKSKMRDWLQDKGWGYILDNSIAPVITGEFNVFTETSAKPPPEGRNEERWMRNFCSVMNGWGIHFIGWGWYPENENWNPNPPGLWTEALLRIEEVGEEPAWSTPSYGGEILIDEIRKAKLKPALIKQYFPVYNFSAGEQWYPCSFYFDENGETWPFDLYNKNSYDTYSPWPPSPYAYTHIIQNSTHITLQYWLYYVWNDHWIWGTHDSDWDSTIYIVLQKDINEPIPIAIHYFFHDIKEYLPWNSWPEKEDSTHPIVYVSEGSHGAYPSPDEMLANPKNWGVDDLWQPGGIILRQTDFNWYILGDSIDHRHSFLGLGPHCDLDLEWTEGESQWEFDSNWWPKTFPKYLVTFLDAPWHRTDWLEMQPKSSSILSIIGLSPINLRVTNPNGLRVGFDPELGEQIIEIPGARYSGLGTEPQRIIIPSPMPGVYLIDRYGTGEGAYTIMIESILDDGTIADSETWMGTASPGILDRGSIQMFEDGSFADAPHSVIPEIPWGTVTASVTMIVAFLAYIIVPKWRRKRYI